MGRAAKYFTKADRLKARRERRAMRVSGPAGEDVKASRRRENQRHYQKKKGIRLLQTLAPAIAPSLHALAAEEIVDMNELSIFYQFRDGRDTIGFDEFDLVPEDFEGLTGMPPYQQLAIHSATFKEEWPRISAAMHGYATRKYLDELAILAGIKAPPHVLIFDLAQKHQTFSTKQDILARAHQKLVEGGHLVEGLIAQQNMRWNSRMVEYSWEDIQALQEGDGHLQQMISERQWTLGHGPRKVY